MRKSEFLHNPGRDYWASLKHSDDAYREWIRRQPSCISGNYSEYVGGDGMCIAAHVRRAKTFGTGFKAPFSCIPITQQEHDIQHQKGEGACLDKYLPKLVPWSALEAKRWFDEQVEKYIQMWEAL